MMFTKKIIIHTPLSPEAAAERLSAATINPKSAMDSYALEKAWFRGSVHSTRFQITPNYEGGRIFLPVLRGTITAANPGSELRATAYPVWWARLFFGVYIGFMWFGLLSFVIATVSGSVPFGVFLIPLALLGGGYWFRMLFSDPGEETEARLRKLLEK